jgi:HAD superfamily hydrolase (TIGR01509 family)
LSGKHIVRQAPEIKSACFDPARTYHLKNPSLDERPLAGKAKQHVTVSREAQTGAFDLVILDCDGVLVDSEVISTHTLLDTLVASGLEVDIDYVRKTYLGRSISVVKEDYLRLTGRDLTASFEADFLARLFAAYRNELSAMAGVKELIASIPGAYCMATSSSIERATLSLELTGLLPFFEGRIFCAAMVARGKPAPDLFLHAARAFDAEPARCLVIEDSEVGLLAGQNAGMTVWRFVGGSHFKDRAEASPAVEFGVPVFHSMDAMAAKLLSD